MISKLFKILGYITSNSKNSDESGIGKDLHGSGRGLLEAQRTTT
jgi:hypothetical protein